MAGGLVQLVANSNSPETIWLERDPEITFFKRVYRRHTPFALESIPLMFDSVLDFGLSSSANILPLGDLVHRIYACFEIPKLAARFLNSKSFDIIKVINSTTFFDKNLEKILKNFIKNETVDLDQIFQTIEDMIFIYDKQSNEILNILNALDNFSDPIRMKITPSIPLLKFYDTSLETDRYQIEDNKVSNSTNDYDIFKNNLREKWIYEKKEYVPIYELLKLTQFLEENDVIKISKIDYFTLPRTLTNRIFEDLISNSNIRRMFDSKCLNLFNSDYHDALNTYSSVISVFKRLANTIPVVIVKPFTFALIDKHDIYSKISFISSEYLPTVVDPNFRTKFLIDSNIPNVKINSYLNYFNQQANHMFDSVRNCIDTLFESYRNRLFLSTNSLFIDGISSDIYHYCLSKNNFYLNNRIFNVFNVNIWYFYFFYYLNLLDENNFTDFVRNPFNLTVSGCFIMRNLILFIKSKIEETMKELSRQMSNLYIDDSLNHYIPPSINSTENMMGITYVYHRNLIPSIIDIFQFIYQNIDNYNEIHEIDPNEFTRVKNIIKSFYDKTLEHFLKIYDEYSFEAKMNYTSPKTVIDTYVGNFLNTVGVYQMEFYFMLEMLMIRHHQKLYSNILLNESVLDKEIINLIKKNFSINSSNDLREYWLNSANRFQNEIFSKIENRTSITYIPIPLIDKNFYDNTPFCNEIFVDWMGNVTTSKNYLNPEKFELYEIDVSGILHSFFYENKLNHLLNADQLNLFKLKKLTQQLIDNIESEYDIYLIEWISNTLNSLNEFPLENLLLYRKMIDNSMENEKYLIDLSFLIIIVDQLNNIPEYYGISDLLEIKKYLNQIKNSNIIDSLEIIRDIYLTEYHFYAKYLDSIVSLNSLMVNGDPIKDIIRFLNNQPEEFSCYVMTHLTDLTKEPCNATLFHSINSIFSTTKQIYLSENFFDRKYQSLLLDKLFMIKLINKHCDLSNDSIEMLAKNADKVGIDSNAFMIYLKNTSDIDLIIYGLDYFLTKSNIRIKDLIIADLDNDFIRNLFEEIDENYYSYIYFFLDFMSENDIDISKIENPLVLLKELRNDNFLNYLMDHIWDLTMISCHYDKTDFKYFEYDDSFTSIMNQKHDLVESSISNKLKEFNDAKKFENLEKVVSDLNLSSNSKEFMKLFTASNQNPPSYFLDQFQVRKEIVNMCIDIAHKNIVLINTYLKQIKSIKNSILNIMYRNNKAKSAWIRKLAHFLVSSVVLTCDNGMTEEHISDWFECFHEISKNDDSEKGYLKMIGHREDLIIFDDKTKNSYIIMLPLQFSFNRRVESSIPLCVSHLNSFRIHITLRDLSDVTYKEEFSDFVNPDLNDLKPYIPKLGKSYLMAEYVYLSNEERRIFFSKYLEYFIEELQYENAIISNNMIPVYQIKSKEYLDSNEIDSLKLSVDVLPRNDYTLKQTKNRSGINQYMMTSSPLKVNTNPTNSSKINSNSNIHKKRVLIRNHFLHPSKFMINVFRLQKHILPEYRNNEFEYFYGEKQWDNYGLNSYYDLSKINSAKLNNYYFILDKLMDMDDENFGFIYLLNSLLVQFENLPEDRWIKVNHAYFLECLSIIKESYMKFKKNIFYDEYWVSFKEYLLSLMIDFQIVEKEILFKMVQDILNKFSIVISREIIAETFGSSSDEIYCNYNKKYFVDRVHFLMSDRIEDCVYSLNEINNVIDSIYTNYNEAVINLLISGISKYLSPDALEYVFKFDLLLMIRTYTIHGNDKTVKDAFDLINERIISLNPETILPKHISYWDIINQILYDDIKDIMDSYSRIIPYYVISIIINKITFKMNELVNNYSIDLIDYSKNIIINPQVNPLLSGYLRFNDSEIMPINSGSILWSEKTAYQYFNHTPSVGINIHSWALHPLANNLSGSSNLSRIDDFTSVFDLHPSISNENPASLTSMVLSWNIVRYISGQCGKVW